MSTRRAVLAGASGAALAALIAPFAVAPAAAATGAHDDGRYVVAHPGRGHFPLVAGGRAAPIVVSAGDHAGRRPGGRRPAGRHRAGHRRAARPSGTTRSRPAATR